MDVGITSVALTVGISFLSALCMRQSLPAPVQRTLSLDGGTVCLLPRCQGGGYGCGGAARRVRMCGVRQRLHEGSIRLQSHGRGSRVRAKLAGAELEGVTGSWHVSAKVGLGSIMYIRRRCSTCSFDSDHHIFIYCRSCCHQRKATVFNLTRYI